MFRKTFIVPAQTYQVVKLNVNKNRESKVVSWIFVEH